MKATPPTATSAAAAIASLRSIGDTLPAAPRSSHGRRPVTRGGGGAPRGGPGRGSPRGLDVGAQRGGLAEEPALAERDAEPAERVELLEGVEALADDARAEPVGDRAERPQQLLAPRVLIDAVHEGAVDLDEVRRELHHRLEARVARARIVERDLEAEAAVVVAHLAEDVEVADRLLLRDLEDHVAGPEPAGLERLRDRLGPERGIVDRGGADVQEELGAAGQVLRAVKAALTAQAVELVDQVLLGGGREERARRVELGALGPARERLVAEDGARPDLDDRLVDRRDLAREHELEEALPAAARADERREAGLLPRLGERGDELRLGGDRRVAQGGSGADRERRELAQVGVRDAVAAACERVGDAAAQVRKLPPVEGDLVRLAEDEHDDLAAPGLSAEHEVVDPEQVARGVGDQRAEVVADAL